MNRGKFKFNAILRVLLLAGTVYANELVGENKAVPEKEMTAPSDKEFAGFAEAQFLYGVYYYPAGAEFLTFVSFFFLIIKCL